MIAIYNETDNNNELHVVTTIWDTPVAIHIEIAIFGKTRATVYSVY